MDGILVVNKPKDCTSRDVVNFISKKFNTRKVGHTGTLDPMATGVLVVLLGKYTSLVEVITAYDKVYEAEITLGLETDTLDNTGNILKEEKVNYNAEQIKSALEKMKKTYNQIVPIYSAVKINGKKLYEYARAGEKIELPTREVTIKSIDLMGNIQNKDDKTIFKIRTEVSKGTYIRSLALDVAKELGTIGIMSDLRRVRQGTIEIADSYTIEQIEANKYQFYDISRCLSNIFTVDLDENMYKKVKNGVKLENIYNQDLVLFKYKGSIAAIYKSEGNILKMWKYLL